MLASSLYGFPTVSLDWSNPVYYTYQLALILLLASAAFPLVVWPKRAKLVANWRAVAYDRPSASILVNLGVFALLLMAKAALANSYPTSVEPFWYWAYCVLVLMTGASLALVAAPPTSWWDLTKSAPLEILLALVTACLVLLAGALSRESWNTLSFATLLVSHWILGLYEGSVFLDTENKILGAEDFRVQIWASCSGYEGIALVVAFLAIYIWAFRSHLRFPNAFCLVPIGIGAIWILNSVRIAMLVSIGAHVSPAVAIDGFHSWSGWIAFLVVTVGIMAASRFSPHIWAVSTPSARVRASSDDNTVELLAPFTAFMVACVVVSAFKPHDQWLYALKVIAIGGTLWWLRDFYVRLLSAVLPVSVLAGVAVGVAWVATDPLRGVESPLGPWLEALPAWLAVGWLATRAVGSIVLVPIAEELAFRGYLCRTLMSSGFANLSPRQLRWIALIVSSVAFGVLHERWLAATISGAVYAALMMRTNKLSDPIAAHMTSNALILLWSIVAQQWTLL